VVFDDDLSQSSLMGCWTESATVAGELVFCNRKVEEIAIRLAGVACLVVRCG
jgi:hypothetical protein